MEKSLICLDTSILIDYFRKTKKEKSIFHALNQQNKSFAVSIITKFEIYCGSRQDQKLFWDKVFDKLLVIPFDEQATIEAVKIYKDLRKRNKLIEIPDLLIAATAKAHQVPLATLNKKHFKRIKGLTLI